MRFIALFFGLLACVACSESNSGGGGGDQTLPDSAASSSGAGTADGGSSVADGKSAGSDGSGSDAATGKIEAKKCIALGKGDCAEAGECNSEQYCDPCLRKCLTPRKACDPCTADIQCEKAEHGSVCLPYASGGSFCGRACESSVGCPKAYECKQIAGFKPPQDKQCVPKTGSCGKSTGACKTDSQCPFTKICNPEFGICIKGCASDQECPSTKVCSLFRCTDPCTQDSDCKKLSEEAKCEGKICKIPGGCLGPPDCPKKATYCDLTAHKCKDGCQVDADCKEFAKKCVSGACVEKGCKENWECAFEQVCEPASGKCIKAVGKFCAKCDPQDKKAAACDGAPNKCFSFQDKDGKKLGDFCAVTCSTDPAGECPQGYECQEVPDQNGKPIGKFCMRQCWQSPF